MKANELRIGNYIQLYRKPEDKEMSVHRVMEIWQSPENGWHFVTIEDGFKVNAASGVVPIPLTKEILYKCGARGGNLIEHRVFLPITNLKSEIHFEMFPNTDEIVSTLWSGSCRLIFDRIYYLHQLQNLYHSLTGKELEITL